MNLSKNQQPTLEFDILIRDDFSNLCTDTTITPTNNKKVLSLINDFEEGRWRQSKFNRFIWNNIAETALSFNERKCLIDEPSSTLVNSAKNLRFTDKGEGQGSELAEVVLYGIMKHYYDALPVVPKIFYKQNSQDNAKGMDSVHIVVNKTGDDFTLWFGEAKFYNSIEDARLNEIITSVEKSLKTDKLKKENRIITNIQDLDGLIESEELKENIKTTLSNRRSIDELKLKLHIPILLLHECPITAKEDCFTDTYKENIRKYHIDRSVAYFKRQVAKCGTTIHKYNEIHFHLILFPVPNKDAIVKKFIKTVEHYKQEAEEE